MYKSVYDLHTIGIMHGDLEPRNVARVRGGGFRLIDFSESREHHCIESKVQYLITSLLIAANKEWPGERQAPHSVQRQMCSELLTLRKLLRRR